MHSAPVTLKSIVADALAWAGLGRLANHVPLPALPVPGFVESLWLAVRKSQYTFNNQRPTLATTVFEPDPASGVITGTLAVADLEGDALTVTIAVQPKYGTVTLDEAGNFYYTPASAAPVGTVSFEVTVDDRIGNPTHYHGLLGLFGLLGPVHENITLIHDNQPAPGDAPRWGDPAYFMVGPAAATGVVAGGLSATDDDPYSLRYIVTQAPDAAAGTLDLTGFSESGAWRFIPNPDARVAAYYGDEGPRTATFTVVASDGISQTEPISITVDIAPRAAEQVFTPPAGSRFNGAPMLGTDGTLYQTVSTPSVDNSNTYTTWIVGTTADGTRVETAHVIGAANLGGDVTIGEYGIYKTVVDRNTQQIQVIGISSDGTPAEYVLSIYGYTGNRGVVVNKYGVYQSVTDYDNDQTIVVTVAGEGAPLTIVDGTSAFNGGLTSGDQGVYLTVFDGVTEQTTVATIAGEGPAITTVSGTPGFGGLAIGEQGVYLTVTSRDSPTVTTVYRLAGNGPATTVIDGFAQGPVAIGPSGVYQTTGEEVDDVALARVVTIVGDGPALTEIPGDPHGRVVVSEYGVYQVMYDATARHSTIVRIAGDGGPASTVVDGYVSELDGGPWGVYALTYQYPDSGSTAGVTTTVTTIAGTGVPTVTATGSPVTDNAIVQTDRGVYVTIQDSRSYYDAQLTVLTIAGEGAPVLTVDGLTGIGGVQVGPAGVYLVAGAPLAGDDDQRVTTVWKIAGDGQESVTLPPDVGILVFPANGTGYYVRSSSELLFVDTTRSVSGTSDLAIAL
ncbi:hypothetical protein MycrhDRAFT_6802 [Mycolicibacterium rhodesiae JS60]|nr:hypothetical protein MycrhDRAFT_6802 [Mycolicibacterium rhodesiae JS60]